MGSDGVDENFEVEKIAPSPDSNLMEPPTRAGDDNEDGSVLREAALHGASLVPSTLVLPKLPSLPKVNTKHADLVKAQARLTSALMEHCGGDTTVITKACMAHISSSRYPDPQALLVTLSPFTSPSAAVDIVSSIWHFLYSSSRDSLSRRESPGGRRRHRRRSLSDGEEPDAPGDRDRDRDRDRHRSQRKRHRRYRGDNDFSDSEDMYDDESAYRRRKRQRRYRHRGSHQSRSRSRSYSSSRSESSLREPTEEHDRIRRREARRSRYRDRDRERDRERDRHYERRRHRDRHRDKDRDKDYERGTERDRGSGRHRERDRERAHDRDPEHTLDNVRDPAPEKGSRKDGHTAREKGHRNELPTETFSNRNPDLDRAQARSSRAGRVIGESTEVLDKQGDVQKPHRNPEWEEDLRRADERSERYLRRHSNSVRQSGSHRAEKVGDVAYSASDGEQYRPPRNRVHDYDHGYDRDHERDYDRNRVRGRDHSRIRDQDVRDQDRSRIKERTRDYNYNRARGHDRDRDQVRNPGEDGHIRDRRERLNPGFDSEPELGTDRYRRNPRDSGSKQGHPERGFEQPWKGRGRHSDFKYERRRDSKLTPERGVDEKRDFERDDPNELINLETGRDNRDSGDVAYERSLDYRAGKSKEDQLRSQGGPSRRNYREPTVGPSGINALEVNGLEGRNEGERQFQRYDGERSVAIEDRHRQSKLDWDSPSTHRHENASGEDEKYGQHPSGSTPAWLSRNNAQGGLQNDTLEPPQQMKSNTKSSTHVADHQDAGTRSKVKEETPLNVGPIVTDVKIEEDRVAEARWKRFSKVARIVPDAGATTAEPRESGPSPRSGTKPSGSSSKLELLRSQVLKSMKKAPGNEGGGNDSAGPNGAGKQLQ